MEVASSIMEVATIMEVGLMEVAIFDDTIIEVDFCRDDIFIEVVLRRIWNHDLSTAEYIFKSTIIDAPKTAESAEAFFQTSKGGLTNTYLPSPKAGTKARMKNLHSAKFQNPLSFPKSPARWTC